MSDAQTPLGAPWLEVVDGSAPILLVAPHGGRAGPAARRRLNPKVNDLHTAGITRVLAERLSASALINAAMDRNHLDCNRLGQLIEQAPWLLELIARRLDEMVVRHGRAVVLLIHGWNVIEPRVDFGLGARFRNGKLVPAGSAHISAGDEFINHTVADLAERLRRDGIVPSFGQRYPAGGLHNLLQAFTPRHLENPDPALRRLSALGAQRAIDALQLELSVAVRMPGTLRERALDALGAAFSANGDRPRPAAGAIPVIRSAPPKPPAHPRPERTATPARVGIEFYDPVAGLGAMASFDLGAAATGARIMMLLDSRRVALFTSEGAIDRADGRVTRGPLALNAGSHEVALEFGGPMVIVPDSRAYLSIERALASGKLDEAARVSVRLDLNGAAADLLEILSGDGSHAPAPDSGAAFGRVTGEIVVDGATRRLDAVGRVGFSFTGLGATRFTSRRMVWACFPQSSAHAALEARVIAADDGSRHSVARVLGERGWTRCEIEHLDLETPSVKAPPERIAARLAIDGAAPAPLIGEPRCFVPLSRPGPGQSRIYTALGFASFSLGPHRGAGMFEYSRCAEPRAALAQIAENDETD